MKQYVIRSIKFFIFIVALLVIIIAVLILAGFVEGGIENIFRNGYDAIWQIALIEAAFAAIYPKIGFFTRKTYLSGGWSEVKDVIQSTMQNRSYVLTNQTDDTLIFRVKNIVARIPKFFADEITITRIEDADVAEDVRPTEENDEAVIKAEKCVVAVEGLSKDVLRIVSALEGSQRQNNAQ